LAARHLIRVSPDIFESDLNWIGPPAYISDKLQIVVTISLGLVALDDQALEALRSFCAENNIDGDEISEGLESFNGICINELLVRTSSSDNRLGCSDSFVCSAFTLPNDETKLFIGTVQTIIQLGDKYL
jgi:hypothetical protein